MKEKYHATLQPSETAIFQAAAQIFSSYAASKTSITICSIVEKGVKSDEEIS